MFVINKFSSLFLGLIFLLTFNTALASDVIAIKPVNDIVPASNEYLDIIQPDSDQKKSKKKKRHWFQNIKGELLEKRLTKLFPVFQFDSLKCDVITLKSGEEIEAKILEVNTGAIVYELCDQENGPRRTLLISKVFMVKYADGYKEVFNNNTQTNTVESERTGPDKNAFIIGFALGFLMGLVGVLIAYVIFRNDVYSRKKATRGGLLGVLALILLYFYLLSLV